MPAFVKDNTDYLGLPTGHGSAAGLPVGVMHSGRPGAERTLLELAFELVEADQPFRRLQDV